jgi:hypothetical protein
MSDYNFKTIADAEFSLTKIAVEYKQFSDITVAPMNLINDYYRIVSQANKKNLLNNFYQVLSEYEVILLALITQTIKQNLYIKSCEKDTNQKVKIVPNKEEKMLMDDFKKKYFEVTSLLNQEVHQTEKVYQPQQTSEPKKDSFGNIIEDIFSCNSFEELVNKL